MVQHLEGRPEATQGQIDDLFSQLPYKCHQNRVASVGDCLKICPWVTSGVFFITVDTGRMNALQP